MEVDLKMTILINHDSYRYFILEDKYYFHLFYFGLRIYNF